MKPRSFIIRAATKNIAPSTPTRIRNGTPRFVACAITPPSTDPPSIAAPPTICPLPITDSSVPSYCA